MICHASAHAIGACADALRKTRGAPERRDAEFTQPLGALADSPAVLVGSVEACVERLLELRERYGFSYFNLGGDVDMVAPLVARLAGS